MSALIVIGGTGELGHQTVLAAEAAGGWPGDILATYHNSAPARDTTRATWQRLDCGDHKAVRSLLAGHGSVGAVAYCAVPKGANANAKASDTLRAGIVDDVLNCAEAACMIGARFVAVSTDLVFDGRLAAGQVYATDSAVSPINAYGRCKAEMEKRLLGLSGRVAIARTSLILSVPKERSADAAEYGKGARFVLECIQGRHGEIALFTDETRSMSFADDLGRAMVELARAECALNGVVHMVSGESTNRWELARLMAAHLGLDHLLGKDVKSGLSAESGMTRPLNCALAPTPLATKIQGISARYADKS